MCLHGSPQPAAHACESRCVVSVESIAQPGAAILHRSRWSLAIPPRRALRRPPPAESPAAVRVAVVGIDLHPTSTLTLAPRLVHIRRGEIAGSGRDVLWRLCPPPPRRAASISNRPSDGTRSFRPPSKIGSADRHFSPFALLPLSSASDDHPPPTTTHPVALRPQCLLVAALKASGSHAKHKTMQRRLGCPRSLPRFRMHQLLQLFKNHFSRMLIRATSVPHRSRLGFAPRV